MQFVTSNAVVMCNPVAFYSLLQVQQLLSLISVETLNLVLFLAYRFYYNS